MRPDSLIHLRVPAATKGRWVRASRAAGVRLTDWIVDAVEARMQQQMTKAAIPEHGGEPDPVAEEFIEEAVAEECPVRQSAINQDVPDQHSQEISALSGAKKPANY